MNNNSNKIIFKTLIWNIGSTNCMSNYHLILNKIKIVNDLGELMGKVSLSFSSELLWRHKPEETAIKI